MMLEFAVRITADQAQEMIYLASRGHEESVVTFPTFMSFVSVYHLTLFLLSYHRFFIFVRYTHSLWILSSCPKHLTTQVEALQPLYPGCKMFWQQVKFLLKFKLTAKLENHCLDQGA